MSSVPSGDLNLLRNTLGVPAEATDTTLLLPCGNSAFLTVVMSYQYARLVAEGAGVREDLCELFIPSDFEHDESFVQAYNEIATQLLVQQQQIASANIPASSRYMAAVHSAPKHWKAWCQKHPTKLNTFFENCALRLVVLTALMAGTCTRPDGTPVAFLRIACISSIVNELDAIISTARLAVPPLPSNVNQVSRKLMIARWAGAGAALFVSTVGCAQSTVCLARRWRMRSTTGLMLYPPMLSIPFSQVVSAGALWGVEEAARSCIDRVYAMKRQLQPRQWSCLDLVSQAIMTTAAVSGTELSWVRSTGSFPPLDRRVEPPQADANLLYVVRQRILLPDSSLQYLGHALITDVMEAEEEDNFGWHKPNPKSAVVPTSGGGSNGPGSPGGDIQLIVETALSRITDASERRILAAITDIANTHSRLTDEIDDWEHRLALLKNQTLVHVGRLLELEHRVDLQTLEFNAVARSLKAQFQSLTKELKTIGSRVETDFTNFSRQLSAFGESGVDMEVQVSLLSDLIGTLRKEMAETKTSILQRVGSAERTAKSSRTDIYAELARISLYLGRTPGDKDPRPLDARIKLQLAAFEKRLRSDISIRFEALEQKVTDEVPIGRVPWFTAQLNEALLLQRSDITKVLDEHAMLYETFTARISSSLGFLKQDMGQVHSMANSTIRLLLSLKERQTSTSTATVRAAMIQSYMQARALQLSRDDIELPFRVPASWKENRLSIDPKDGNGAETLILLERRLRSYEEDIQLILLVGELRTHADTVTETAKKFVSKQLLILLALCVPIEVDFGGLLGKACRTIDEGAILKAHNITEAPSTLEQLRTRVLEKWTALHGSWKKTLSRDYAYYTSKPEELSRVVIIALRLAELRAYIVVLLTNETARNLFEAERALWSLLAKNDSRNALLDNVISESESRKKAVEGLEKRVNTSESTLQKELAAQSAAQANDLRKFEASIREELRVGLEGARTLYENRLASTDKALRALEALTQKISQNQVTSDKEATVDSGIITEISETIEDHRRVLDDHAADLDDLKAWAEKLGDVTEKHAHKVTYTLDKLQISITQLQKARIEDIEQIEVLGRDLETMQETLRDGVKSASQRVNTLESGLARTSELETKLTNLLATLQYKEESVTRLQSQINHVVASMAQKISPEGQQYLNNIVNKTLSEQLQLITNLALQALGATISSSISTQQAAQVASQAVQSLSNTSVPVPTTVSPDYTVVVQRLLDQQQIIDGLVARSSQPDEMRNYLDQVADRLSKLENDSLRGMAEQASQDGHYLHKRLEPPRDRSQLVGYLEHMHQELATTAARPRAIDLFSVALTLRSHGIDRKLVSTLQSIMPGGNDWVITIFSMYTVEDAALLRTLVDNIVDKASIANKVLSNFQRREAENDMLIDGFRQNYQYYLSLIVGLDCRAIAKETLTSLNMALTSAAVSPAREALQTIFHTLSSDSDLVSAVWKKHRTIFLTQEKAWWDQSLSYARKILDARNTEVGASCSGTDVDIARLISRYTAPSMDFLASLRQVQFSIEIRSAAQEASHVVAQRRAHLIALDNVNQRMDRSLQRLLNSGQYQSSYQLPNTALLFVQLVVDGYSRLDDMAQITSLQSEVREKQADVNFELGRVLEQTNTLRAARKASNNNRVAKQKK